MIRYARVVYLKDKVISNVPITYVKATKKDEKCISPLHDQDFFPDKVYACKYYFCKSRSVYKCNQEACSHEFDYYSAKIILLGRSNEELNIKKETANKRIIFPSRKMYSSDSDSILPKSVVPDLMKIKQEKDVDINASMMKTSKNQLHLWKINNNSTKSLIEPLPLDASLNSGYKPELHQSLALPVDVPTENKAGTKRDFSTIENGPKNSKQVSMSSKPPTKRIRIAGVTKKELIAQNHRQEIEIALLKSQAAQPGTSQKMHRSEDSEATLPSSVEIQSTKSPVPSDTSIVEYEENQSQSRVTSPAREEIPDMVLGTGHKEHFDVTEDTQQKSVTTVNKRGSSTPVVQQKPSTSTQAASVVPIQSSVNFRSKGNPPVGWRDCSPSVRPSAATCTQSSNNDQRAVADTDTDAVCNLIMSKKMSKGLEGYKPLSQDEAGKFLKKRPFKRKESLILYCVQYYKNPHCPGHSDYLRRYSVDKGLKYLGDNMAVCEEYWDGVAGCRRPQKFFRDVMDILWTPDELLERSLEPESCRSDQFLPGRGRPKAIEFGKLRLLISLYDDYLNKKFKSDKKKYLMQATTVLSNELRDLKAEEREKILKLATRSAQGKENTTSQPDIDDETDSADKNKGDE